MTADRTRQELAAALAHWDNLPPWACLNPRQRDAVTAALTPVVEQLQRQAAATALRAAADGLSQPNEIAWLRARADELDPS